MLDFPYHGRSKKYRFPPTSFDVGSLMVLKLYYCVLDETLIQKDTGFNRLKELTLFETDFDGVVVELLSRSPNLEILILKPSRGSIDKYIELCDLPKLKKVEFWPQGYSYKIEAANLQTLIHNDCMGFSPLPDIGALNCGNIKEIKMYLGHSTVTKEYIVKLISKFPFLEELILRASLVSKEQKGSRRLDELQD